MIKGARRDDQGERYIAEAPTRVRASRTDDVELADQSSRDSNHSTVCFLPYQLCLSRR